MVCGNHSLGPLHSGLENPFKETLIRVRFAYVFRCLWQRNAGLDHARLDAHREKLQEVLP